MKESTILGPHGEPTPPSSHHPITASPTTPFTSTAGPDSPLTPLQEILEASNHGDVRKEVANEHGIKCMFQTDCDTGSQLRKAISHIFGRNKMCTRLVPAQVWVHYCRKHYQRSRYRNPKEYAKLQCDLVQKQIRRIHDWSLQNQRNNRPGVVQDWGLAVRKREQKRIDELSGAKRKRSITQYDDSEDGDNMPVPATAVPRWLRELCGKGYDTHSILSIFNRLHTEILNDLMPQFPDIEILPNIAVEADEPQQPKGYVKRPGAGAGHRRSQSLGMGVNLDVHSPNIGTSPSTSWGSNSSPMQKRQRRNGTVEAAPFGRRIQGAHRPVYSSIAENQDEMDEMRFANPWHQPQLAAPTPQRLRAWGRDMYSGHPYAPVSAHPLAMGNYGPAHFQQQAPPNSFSYNSHHRGQSYQGHHQQQESMLSTKQLPDIRHARHQSSPMAQFHTSPSMQGLPSLSQPLSHNNTLPPVGHLAESIEANSLYRERR
ncbi:hypothetical protein LSUE1_G003903 [Lachnellula suecica]|uniref:ORP1 n=1 Tax=Lachnellula suecica TaxID=602035 RepID=A0A8T9C4T7_9HELO|nr:hypothetical protein LSUE1_G003903 [Lachnellula suecica]